MSIFFFKGDVYMDHLLAPPPAPAREKILKEMSDVIELTQDEQLEAFADKFNIAQKLSTNQLKILYELIMNTFADHKLSMNEIARRSGISERSIAYMKLNKEFVEVYNHIVKILASNLTGEVLENLRKLSQTQTSAGKLLLEYTEQFIPRSQQAIISHKIQHNLSNGDVRSPQSAVVEFVVRFGALGYDKERLLLEVNSAYDALKAENAF